MKVYKVEVMVIDFDELGAEGIKSAIENSNYPNDCISPKVQNIEGRDIGEWDDNHPLNNRKTASAAYKELFS